ncbi:MAG: 2,3,4,5-tetrahydropyridine-2,6-dicarboxylate N-succinyltransferase, partial [Burkholderiaceae bacterium]
MNHAQLESTINAAWEDRAKLNPTNAPADIREAVQTVLDALDAGQVRVAEKLSGSWTVHQWIKKAVLLSFRLSDNAPVSGGQLQFFDKVPTKFEGLSAETMRSMGVRVVPPAVARRGSFLAKNVVLMPSYVNIGAYVDEGTMVDTWA